MPSSNYHKHRRHQGRLRPSNHLVYAINACSDCRSLGQVIRNNQNLFHNEAAVNALDQKTSSLKNEMTNRDISGIMNTLSKAHVPSASRAKVRALLSSLGVLAIEMLWDFTARDMSMTLNALAKWNIYNGSLFRQVRKRAIPIMHSFDSQALANIVNAYAKMGHQSSELFQAVATAAIPIMHSFNSQDLANIVNAYAKMGHQSSELFQAVATAAIPIMHSFNSQEMANIVNAYSKMGHQSSELFQAVATAAIPIMHSFNSQALANIIGAFSRNRVSCQASSRLFLEASLLIASSKSSLASWEGVNLVEIAYAFMKGRHMNKNVWNAIGSEIVKRDQVLWNAHQLGNLAAAFSNLETTSSVPANVLKMIFQRIQSMKASEIGLQTIADVCGAISLGQQLEVVPSGFVKELVELAIEKSNESRPEDTRDVLIRLSKINVEKTLLKELFVHYRPIFDKDFKYIAKKRRIEILEIYKQFD
jgi:hypothetical protein